MLPRIFMTRVFFNIQEGLKELFLRYAILNLYMKTLSCRDAGCDCDYIAKGETEEEVIRDAAQHGMKEHGKTQEDMTQMQSNLRAAIRSS
jgi:predicted small metal-binding protein